jgi:hypothetical protein
MGNMGKLTTALTYVMTIAVGVVFAYFTCCWFSAGFFWSCSARFCCGPTSSGASV